MTNYYAIKTMDVPSAEMYDCVGQCALLIGTARPQPWAVAVDIDPAAPADVIADGLALPFKDKQFDVAILDYTTNFVRPAHVMQLIQEARRVAHTVKGRCHIGTRTFRGPKPRWPHATPPPGVQWISIRLENGITLASPHPREENSQ